MCLTLTGCKLVPKLARRVGSCGRIGLRLQQLNQCLQNYMLRSWASMGQRVKLLTVGEKGASVEVGTMTFSAEGLRPPTASAGTCKTEVGVVRFKFRKSYLLTRRDWWAESLPPMRHAYPRPLSVRLKARQPPGHLVWQMRMPHTPCLAQPLILASKRPASLTSGVSHTSFPCVTKTPGKYRDE